VVKAYVRTHPDHYARCMVVEFDGGGKVELWGDPAKAVASLLIFTNSTVKSWVSGKGLEVEVPEEAREALIALGRRPPTWKEAAEKGFLQNPTPQHVIRTLALNAILKG